MASPDLPLAGLCFELTTSNKILGVFSECDGLRVEVGSEDYKEGGNNGFTWKLPTQATHPPLVLKRGISASQDLWQWVADYLDTARVKPKNVQISLLDGPGGKQVRTWIATAAYPLKWDGPKLHAIQGAIVFESIELAHQGLKAGRSSR